MKRQLICNGDSWVFGSELVDPNIAKNYPSDVHIGNYDHLKINDEYRIPKIFLTNPTTGWNARVHILASTEELKSLAICLPSGVAKFFSISISSFRSAII